MASLVLKPGVKVNNFYSDKNGGVNYVDGIPFLAANVKRKELFLYMPSDIDELIDDYKKENDVFILDNNDSNNNDVWISKYSTKIPVPNIVGILDKVGINPTPPISKAILEVAIDNLSSEEYEDFNQRVRDLLEEIG